MEVRLSENVETCKLTHDTIHSADSPSAITSFSNISTRNVHTAEKDIVYIVCNLFAVYTMLSFQIGHSFRFLLYFMLFSVYHELDAVITCC